MSRVVTPVDTAVDPPHAAALARLWTALPALWITRRRAALVAAVAGVLVYVGSVLNGFAYDDAAIVAGDPRVRGFQLLNIFRLPYWSRQANLAIYRPFTTLSFAVDWLVSRGYPWYFHAINVLEHGAVSALVFLLLAEIFSPAAALAGALVFALHPVHVEAVANVVGRAEMASAIFYLAALLIWIRGGSRPKPQRVALIALCYAVALLFKESSATLPAALVLVDAALGRWSLRWRALRDYLRRTLPLLAALALVLAGLVALRLSVLGRITPAVLDSTFDLPMGSGGRIMTALQCWPVYTRLLFFPSTLLADYGPRIIMPALGWTPTALLGLGILLLLLVGGFGALARGRGRAALALLWFPLTVLPVSNLLFPIGIIVAERTLYLPMLALCVATAMLAERVAAPTAPVRMSADPVDGEDPIAVAEPADPATAVQATTMNPMGSAPLPEATMASAAATVWPALSAWLGVATFRRAALAGFAVVLGLFALRTVTRVPAWDSTNSIFFALKADAPESFRAWWHLARVARNEKKVDLEMSRYEHALRLWPYREPLVMEVIAQAIAHKRLIEARNLAAFAVRRWPRDLSAQRYLAATSLDLGDTATARVAARAGLALSPGDSTLLDLRRRILPQTAVKGR